MYSLKIGVTIHVTPEIEKILSIVCPVFRAFQLPVVITSGLDGPHRIDSLHYRFRAIDVRKLFPETEHSHTWSIHAKNILDGLKVRVLQAEYPIRVINESDHLHIEWYGS